MSENYEEFVEKFKPKLTTDDCYTPPLVYDAVRDWAVAEYALQGCEIVRPFYPGGDYENYDYSENCVVIDNPPFSILSKIRTFYAERGVGYFLFAPHLTLFSAYSTTTAYIICGEDITYENGAKVVTDYVTNLEKECFIRTAPTLKKAIHEANAQARAERVVSLPKYQYPDTVVSAARLGKVANIDFRLKRGECSFTRALESQHKAKKTIFGGGYLISELRAAELRAAELRAAKEVQYWELSEREKEIISGLAAAEQTGG